MSIRAFLGLSVIGVASTLGGCASLLEGTSQEILVSTNPSGANCILEREGQTIGSVQSTPAQVTVRRRKYDITIRCNKEGFEEATYVNNSGLASGAVAGNVAADLLLTAGLSSIVDSASGADNQYEGTVNITLIPKTAAANAQGAPSKTQTAQPPAPAEGKGTMAPVK